MMSDAPLDSRRHALVIAGGGDPLPPTLASRLPIAAFVIAADSGVEHAQRLGRPVDLVVGDLDSVDPKALEAATASGAAIEAHSPEKDFTDLELALNAARSRGTSAITVVGGYGGRLDHFLANLLALTTASLEDCLVDAWFGPAHVTVVRSQRDLQGRSRSLCTLLALGGAALGVTTNGLRYPLHDDDLLPGSTRGVSNELLAETASVSVRDGTVLVIQPQALEEP
jgi:thiamine pyrophosphokinase